MKTAATVFLLTLAAALPAQAQLFRPDTVNGAVLGGLAGAIIGNNSGDHNGARGALIGALAGGLLGSASADANDRRTQAVPPNYVYAPGYYASAVRPDPVASSMLFGGLAGAIIGHNSGRHNAWRGAAIGAGTGWLIGRMAEDQWVRESTPAPVVIYRPAPAAVAPAAPAPAPVTIINNYYSGAATPMSSANSMFGR